MSQIALPLEWPDDPSDDEFLIGTSNARAIDQLDRWATWPVMAALLVGPRKSGRSLLARIFAAKTGGRMIDDAERVGEAQLFHAWNEAQARRRPLVMVADAAPPEWQVSLPDLRSRLGATPVIRLAPPDDVLMQALIERQLVRRGVDLPPEVSAWLVARIERSHIAALRAVDALDQAVLERRRRLTVPLAREALARAGLRKRASFSRSADR